jgi:hypothetical protein
MADRHDSVSSRLGPGVPLGFIVRLIDELGQPGVPMLRQDEGAGRIDLRGTDIDLLRLYRWLDPAVVSNSAGLGLVDSSVPA